MLTNIRYRILKRISPGAPDCCSGPIYERQSKLIALMGMKSSTRLSSISAVAKELMP